jgi:hypothetical protein
MIGPEEVASAGREEREDILTNEMSILPDIFPFLWIWSEES